MARFDLFRLPDDQGYVQSYPAFGVRWRRLHSPVTVYG